MCLGEPAAAVIRAVEPVSCLGAQGEGAELAGLFAVIPGGIIHCEVCAPLRVIEAFFETDVRYGHTPGEGVGRNTPTPQFVLQGVGDGLRDAVGGRAIIICVGFGRGTCRGVGAVGGATRNTENQRNDSEQCAGCLTYADDVSSGKFKGFAGGGVII